MGVVDFALFVWIFSTAPNDSTAFAQDNSEATAINDSEAVALDSCTATAQNDEEVVCP